MATQPGRPCQGDALALTSLACLPGQASLLPAEPPFLPLGSDRAPEVRRRQPQANARRTATRQGSQVAHGVAAFPPGWHRPGLVPGIRPSPGIRLAVSARLVSGARPAPRARTAPGARPALRAAVSAMRPPA